MSAGEIGWRLRRSFSNRFSGLVPATSAPEAQGSFQPIETWPIPIGLAGREAYIDSAERILAGEADLFGQWVSVGKTVNWNQDPMSLIEAPLVRGSGLDYRDTKLVGSARNTWELNRHLQLVTLGQSWVLTNDARYREAGKKLLESWIRSCPYPLGINWVSALEHGIRLINWYVAARMLKLDVNEDGLTGWAGAIYNHCRFIWSQQSRYSSANNHLIGEMAGLYVASTAWPVWARSEDWRKRTRQVLEEELLKQVYSDGVTKEQTTGYQSFIVQFLLIAGLVGEECDEPFSGGYWQVVKRMLEFLISVRDVRGNVPAVGDADEGIVFSFSPSGRDSMVDDLQDLAKHWSSGHTNEANTMSPTASWLSSGFRKPANWPSGSLQQKLSFPEGGYHILGTRFGDPGEVKILMDTGSLGYLSIAAHGHADCLSFTFSVTGQPILIDPGTYTYHEKPEWRDYFRGTRAHNTVTIDGLDQSEIGGPFMWLRKAEASLSSLERNDRFQSIEASHDGYLRLPDPVLHARLLKFFPDESMIEVVDRIEGQKTHAAERFWHFAPECQLEQVAESEVEIRVRRIRMHCTFEVGTVVDIFEGSRDPLCGWYSPRFGELVPSPSLRLTNKVDETAVLRTTIRWNSE